MRVAGRNFSLLVLGLFAALVFSGCGSGGSSGGSTTPTPPVVNLPRVKVQVNMASAEPVNNVTVTLKEGGHLRHQALNQSSPGTAILWFVHSENDYIVEATGDGVDGSCKTWTANGMLHAPLTEDPTVINLNLTKYNPGAGTYNPYPDDND